MSESIVTADSKAVPPTTTQQKPTSKPVWQTPKLEDVSEQVMAQPYIRFT